MPKLKQRRDVARLDKTPYQRLPTEMKYEIAKHVPSLQVNTKLPKYSDYGDPARDVWNAAHVLEDPFEYFLKEKLQGQQHPYYWDQLMQGHALDYYDKFKDKMEPELFSAYQKIFPQFPNEIVKKIFDYNHVLEQDPITWQREEMSSSKSDFKARRKNNNEVLRRLNKFGFEDEEHPIQLDDGDTYEEVTQRLPRRDKMVAFRRRL